MQAKGEAVSLEIPKALSGPGVTAPLKSLSAKKGLRTLLLLMV